MKSKLKKITRNEYEDLCKSCDKILSDSNLNKITLAIGWLHILRWDPDSFRQYNCIFEHSNVFRETYLRLYRLSRFRLISCVRVLKSIFQRKFWDSYGPISETVDVIFVSHLVSLDLIGREDDFYFGSLPNDLKSQGLNSIISLINYTKRPKNVTSNNWNNPTVPRIVLSRILPFFAEIKIHVLQQIERRRIKKLQSINSDLFNRTLIEASVQSLSNSTTNALRIGVQFEKLLKIHKPKFIVTTYEGYAWERIVFAIAKEVCPKIKCIGYQHSAIFESQHSIFSNLPSNCNPDFVLTTGELNKKILQEKFEKTHTKVKSLGSPRASNFDVDLKNVSSSNKSVCLVLPNGSVSECNIMFEFSLQCAKKMPEVDFIWRVHPLIDIDSLIRSNSKLGKLTKNIIISTKSLDSDISKSSFALYRSSTAIISAISRGLVPIYFETKEDLFSLDPLFKYTKMKRVVSLSTESSDFEKIVNSNFKRTDLIELINYGNGLYTEFNKDIFIDLVLTG